MEKESKKMAIVPRDLQGIKERIRRKPTATGCNPISRALIDVFTQNNAVLLCDAGKEKKRNEYPNNVDGKRTTTNMVSQTCGIVLSQMSLIIRTTIV